MTRIIFIVPLFLILIVQFSSCSVARRMIFGKPGKRLEIDFESTPNKITRHVYNAKDVQQTHVFTVCNGKNKAKCGFWVNSKNKQKVGPPTTYNKKKNLLIIPKARALDAGSYFVTPSEVITVYVM